MRTIALAGLALALSACGGGEGGTAANDANMVATDDMMMGDNMLLDANTSMNGSAGGVGANGAMDGNTQNMMMKDATTNDADTNLANGL
ncbi:MAG TPA: hypothetical protein VF650_13430 [Allosphingosinicella sp.]|jgi:hypothetical protein